METQNTDNLDEEINMINNKLPAPPVAAADNYNHHQNSDNKVDNSRPFRSVKEAVAIFGERIIFSNATATATATGREIMHDSPKKPFSIPEQETHAVSSYYYTPSSSLAAGSPRKLSSSETEERPTEVLFMQESIKKLETELEETKMELKILKERESETEVALASLNAELHKNMSKLAQAEAAAANYSRLSSINSNNNNNSLMKSVQEPAGRTRSKTDQINQMGLLSLSSSSTKTLAQFLDHSNISSSNTSDEEIMLYRKKKKEKKKKKKPIIPLVGDLFSSKRKASSKTSTTMHNPLFASSKFMNFS